MYGFFFKKGLYNPVGINNFLQKWFAEERQLYKHFGLSVANLMTAAFATFEKEEQSDIIKLL